MRLPREGLEYARLDFTDLPSTGVTVEASLDRKTWSPTVSNGTDYLYLLCGPDYAGGATATVVASGGPIYARVTGNPEVVIRKVGLVTLY